MTTTLPDTQIAPTTVIGGMFDHRWTPEYRDTPVTDVTWAITPAGRKRPIKGNHGLGIIGQLPVMPDTTLAQKPGSYVVTWTLHRADNTSDEYTQTVTVAKD